MWYGLCTRCMFSVCVCVCCLWVRCDCDLLCDVVWLAVLLFWVLVWLSVVLLFRNRFVCLFVSYCMMLYAVRVLECKNCVFRCDSMLMLYGCDCLCVRVCVRVCC